MSRTIVFALVLSSPVNRRPEYASNRSKHQKHDATQRTPRASIAVNCSSRLFFSNNPIRGFERRDCLIRFDYRFRRRSGRHQIIQGWQRHFFELDRFACSVRIQRTGLQIGNNDWQTRERNRCRRKIGQQRWRQRHWPFAASCPFGFSDWSCRFARGCRLSDIGQLRRIDLRYRRPGNFCRIVR